MDIALSSPRLTKCNGEFASVINKLLYIDFNELNDELTNLFSSPWFHLGCLELFLFHEILTVLKHLILTYSFHNGHQYIFYKVQYVQWFTQWFVLYDYHSGVCNRLTLGCVTKARGFRIAYFFHLSLSHIGVVSGASLVTFGASKFLTCHLRHLECYWVYLGTRYKKVAHYAIH